ncbi:CBS domain-containing protein [Angustibacter aerolatus]
MRIADVIRRKGDDVVTITPDGTVERLLALLAEHRIGALVVSVDGTSVAGIVSERDVVRALHEHGPAVLERTVGELMTAEVTTASPDDDVEHLMRTMTEGRFRHVPVVEDGRLVGIASIGDVVKHRIDDLQLERDQLVRYVNG